MLRRLRRTPVWLPSALLALLLGFWQLGRPLLWRDELATWSAANRSLGQLWGLLGNVDAVSGAYYLFLHGWTAVLGDSPVALRTPSVLATGLAAGLTAATGKRLFGARAGLWAGLLFALTPAVLRYAQEARAYGMVTAAVLLATWQLVRILSCKPGWSRRRMRLEWLGYAGTLVLVGLLHLVALAVLTSHLWLVLTRRRGAWRGLLAATVSAVLLLSPLLVAGHAQSGRQINWIPRPNLVAFPGMIHDLTYSWPISVALLVLAVLACTRRDGLRYLPVPILPIVTIWIASQGTNSYWVERYLLFTVPLWTILAGAGAERLPRARWTAPAAVVLVAALAFPGLKAQSDAWSHTGTDWRGAARLIGAQYHPGDAVVPERGGSAVYMVDLGLDYYFPARVHPKDLFVAQSAVARDDLMVKECAHPVACLNGAPRVWVVTFGHASDPLSGLPKSQQAALRGHYQVAGVHYLKGLTVGLLTAD
ncbi:glycosyltransferase family 39 protein [Streptacidiphilus jiangxiensis]|uniref:Mannosyltransferase n=1 Tax=Streptacidiphilus jiangxiensis TaxID=235985 RepID=A0A1H7M774_STRJI|nr:glycosyltransferase family 39 protein [Streptacidiphilus jiangxiensis]SEL06595.1 mannosyltransferase [Streptacidiphilus jiangxiensis]